MLAQQRILGFGVIESCRYESLFPSARVMAGLAALLFECAPVWVGMTRGAAVKFQSDIPRLPVDAGCVALQAAHLRVGSAQRILCLRVIEAAFPIDRIVTLSAVRPQFATVLVFVAGNATARQSEKRVVEIPSDQRSFRRNDLARVMALSADEGGMFAIKNEAGPPMVEGLERRLPFDQREIRAIVFRVAAHASGIPLAKRHERRVQPALLFELRAYLAVTLQAFEIGGACRNCVALRTSSRAIKIAVCSRQRTGRNLRGCRGNEHSKQNQCEAKEEQCPAGDCRNAACHPQQGAECGTFYTKSGIAPLVSSWTRECQFLYPDLGEAFSMPNGVLAEGVIYST